MDILFVILLTSAVFVAVILNLAVNTRFKARIMGFSACFAAAAGVLGYGYAYAWAGGFSVATIMRTLLTVCRMFGGVNDFGALSGTPLFKSSAVVALFWIAHFLAFYVTASAAITVLGQRLLRRLRLRLLRTGPVTLVYGANPQTARLVKVPRWGRGLVFVSEHSGEIAGFAEAMGGVVFDGGMSRCASSDFLRQIGVSSDRSMDIYCISPDAGENLRCATALRDALSARGVDGERVSLFLLGVSESRAVKLLASEGRFGYGSLFACDSFELTARLAIRRLPPWSRVDFDAVGRATGSLRTLIVGFGPMGRAMLRQLVMNGQLEGGTFSAQLVDARMDALTGLIETRYSAVLDAYDIGLHQESARSKAFYQRLERFQPNLIYLCTGSRAENAALCRELERFYELREDRPAIVQCAEDSAVIDDTQYRLEHIDIRAMDRLAMVLNHVYCGGVSPEADWRTCDAFSRASCRASVDFYPAYLHILGIDSAGDLEGHWPPQGALLENLARTEHLRWCAFHLAMGYRPMSQEEFDARAERFKCGEKLRIGKNTRAMTHACLVPWEALDDLSRRESAVTGKALDYKQMDIDNVLAIPEIMRREAESKRPQAEAFGSTPRKFQFPTVQIRKTVL